MKNFDLELKEIQLQNEKLIRELAEVHQLLATVVPQNENKKEFYTIEECAIMKGGAALNTYKASARWLLPGAGNPKYASYIGGRLCFHRDVVLEWLHITDADYPEYARRCGIIVIPEKYARLSQKAQDQRSVCNE
jgi:hypothetical protein